MNWKEFISKAFEEDVREGDHTSLSCIPENASGKAQLIVKQEGILAGVEMAKLIFNHFDDHLNFEPIIHDGEKVKAGDIAFYVSGNDRSILTCERLVLNCMQRMSGVATLTRTYVDEIKGTGVKILDTRKTTPLFRAAEKWGVRIGGGHNHRFGLYDMILIKDNHVDYAGGIKQAIAEALKYCDEKTLHIPIEIEVRTLAELQQVLESNGIQRVMLDNFEIPQVQQAIQMVNGKMEVEISGGINLKTIRKYAETNPDFISVGALTHSYTSLDLSLKAF